MVKKLENRRILQYGDFIKVRSEGEIYIHENNLLSPENRLVTESTERIILIKNDFHNILFTGGWIITRTQEQIYQKAFHTELMLPLLAQKFRNIYTQGNSSRMLSYPRQTKNMAEGGEVLTHI